MCQKCEKNFMLGCDAYTGDKLVRATELVKLLSLEKSVRGAIKLVTALKLPNLAERFNVILEVLLLTSLKAVTSNPLSFLLILIKIPSFSPFTGTSAERKYGHSSPPPYSLEL